jgi:MerR family transcriptional regulator, light-induced transcriptional regulator
MMNNIKAVFSIKDLENLSGIKAHTIRIWEKRYDVLKPLRTDTNIRLYDLVGLQKLLNITLLHNHGYKISTISKYPEDQIPELVNEIISQKSVKHHAVNAFKMAMMHFDQVAFTTTYEQLLSEKTFREIFYEVFIPLMNELGLLWQTNTISPSHEHFITYLIKQKIISNTEKIQYKKPTKTDRLFVLFLPDNEIHELGLLYLNYEIINQGYKSIYLGESVPLDSLLDLKKYFNKITYIAYTTVQPEKNQINPYVDYTKEKILDEDSEIWFIGRMTEFIVDDKLNSQVRKFNSVKDLVSEL